MSSVLKFSNASILALTLFYLLLGVSEAKLKVGFYSQTCPNAELIVTSVVKESTATDSKTPAWLLRLHFHDCFVEGCDGSILINNGDLDIERIAMAHQGLRGFEEINKAKSKLETECPGVVSCADIVALAARDAVVLSKGHNYQVETGRRDGLVSRNSLVDDFPDVNDPIQLLKSKFRNKGLSDKELVLLSGAHTIGSTACIFMINRLYKFNGTDQQSDPAINPIFLSQLKTHCPRDGDGNARIPLDKVSDKVFDDQILSNIKDGFATLASDARLNDDGITKQVIESYVGSSASKSSFGLDFGDAMVKMGRIGVKTGSMGEIRKNCSLFN
ncbi:Peroxidase [Actinidia chinensis var. chinensis]|uniref:Peroxidase n=1 Tax=Actinidia chinensis var. chinensis TaxID=1590841 RepID=A0A2R6RNZ8_ACTCC|nr:Peroxidase [Actinidia chinensis var. chinensis]